MATQYKTYSHVIITIVSLWQLNTRHIVMWSCCPINSQSNIVLALFPGLPCFYLTFAVTIILRNWRVVLFWTQIESRNGAKNKTKIVGLKFYCSLSSLIPRPLQHFSMKFVCAASNETLQYHENKARVRLHFIVYSPYSLEPRLLILGTKLVFPWLHSGICT